MRWWWCAALLAAAACSGKVAATHATDAVGAEADVSLNPDASLDVTALPDAAAIPDAIDSAETVAVSDATTGSDCDFDAGGPDLCMDECAKQKTGPFKKTCVAGQVVCVCGADDGGSAGDDADAVTAPDTSPDTGPPEQATATVTAPTANAVYEQGKAVDFTGIVADTVYPPDQLTVTWVSNLDGVLTGGKADATGKVAFSTSKLSPGQHFVTLNVKSPSGTLAQASVSVGICAWQAPNTFDTKLDGSKWKMYGDAYWDPGGWLEMTGNAQSKSGQIFNIGEYIQPGDVQIGFKVQTGGFLTSSGQAKGADGFAMSVVEAKSVADLETYIGKSQPGGCLGYGVSNGCGTLDVKSFHVEIDTWKNDGDPNTDPTPENHIGVMQNGDATKHDLWAPVPNIEDMQWHAVTIVIQKDVVVVTLDGKEVVNGKIPNFKFRGGYIGFSGSTGWATDWHRFDELQILQQCLVK